MMVFQFGLSNSSCLDLRPLIILANTAGTVVLTLTLYRLLHYRRDIPKQSRATSIVDVLWIDGQS